MKSLLLVFALLALVPIYSMAQEPAPPSSEISVQARYELSLGALAYKERKFEKAEEHFKRALSLVPADAYAMRILARTLHQQYLAKRTHEKNIRKGEEAIEIYQRILIADTNDEATNRAVAHLLELIRGEKARDEWLIRRSEDEKVKAEYRADALTSLASRKYNCVSKITETSKKTVEEGDEIVYVFEKPEESEEFDTAKQCAEEGLKLINRALELNETDDSAWSYKASLLIQKGRLAEMEGNIAERDKFRLEGELAKKRFLDLSEEKNKINQESSKPNNR